MKPKPEKEGIPTNVLSFYLKLYANRKRSTETKFENVLVEATKSWLSLNESEKEQFYKKFKECQEKYKANIFSQLKNAELFMKVKLDRPTEDTPSKISISNKEPEENVDDNLHVNEVDQTEQIEETTEQITLDAEESNAETHMPMETHEEEPIENEIGAVDEYSESVRTILIEPAPPTIKTGQELFQLLKATDEANNITWESLQPIEKTQYSRAVTVMKRHYISKYKEYLESLSDKELFDHYNKTIF